MKKFKICCVIFLIVSLLFMITGCGGMIDRNSEWNGFYKSDSGYRIRMEALHKKEIRFSVFIDDEKGNTPITLENWYLPDNGTNTIEYHSDERYSEFFGEFITLSIIKDGDTIFVDASSTNPDSVWNRIGGIYTKYKGLRE